MAFLTPLFLLAGAAIAIPIFVHLIQRERKRVIQFPSLMFVQRIPYQSVRRRRIRHWALLLMRCAAILMIVAAFARPFLRKEAVPHGEAWERAGIVDRAYWRKAAAQGLDPNRWFNNVEQVAAKEIGRETVHYVANIYKYYLAYKMVTEHTAARAGTLATKKKPDGE